MRPGCRRPSAALLVVTALAVLAGLWQVGSGGPLWRWAYPHLPRQVQGLPYRLRAALPARERTPVPLPTTLPPEGHGAPQASPSATLGPPLAALTRQTEASPTASLTVPPTTDLPPNARVTGLVHAYQTWNNCGPATAGMAISAFGPAPDQAEIARELKPDPDDKNVSPDEIVAYLRGRQSLGATWRQGGDPTVLKALLAAGLPVIVETWFVPDPGDEMGHYRVLTGYDDVTGADGDSGRFLAHDSFLGPDRSLAYRAFDADWRAFNRGFAPVYPLAREAEVEAILGPLADDRSMALVALARAQDEVAGLGDAFAWFNLGSSLLATGDPTGASDAYDRARAVGLPWRMLWYQFGPFEAYAAIGRWPDVIALAEANLRNASNLEESHVWLGRAAAANGDRAGALTAFDKALRYHPGFAPAVAARATLVAPVADP